MLPWARLPVLGAVAGYAYASRHRERAAYGWSVDTAVYVSPTRRRCGVGRALCERAGARAYLARVHYFHGRMLAHRGDTAAARPHLETAITSGEEVGMTGPFGDDLLSGHRRVGPAKASAQPRAQSALHVGALLGDLPVANPEDIDPPDVPR